MPLSGSLFVVPKPLMPRMEENVPQKMLRILRIKMVESKCSRKWTNIILFCIFAFIYWIYQVLAMINIQIHLHLFTCTFFSITIVRGENGVYYVTKHMICFMTRESRDHSNLVNHNWYIPRTSLVPSVVVTLINCVVTHIRTDLSDIPIKSTYTPFGGSALKEPDGTLDNQR